ncbi:MAG: hypothetical protein HYY24_23080 [Verrucomicrobia bacterium]|nr:hypothetical protein [Verrucomicrobiota bacterium]
MKPRIIRNTGTVIAFGLWLGLGGYSAIAKSRSGLNTFDFGSSYAGAKGSYSINVENRTGYSRTALNASGTVKFLNKTVKGVEFAATVENSNGRKSASHRLEVAGFTVDSGLKTRSYGWNKAVNKTLVSCSVPITVGPVPVTIRGSVGGGASVSYTFELSSTGVGMSGQGAAWANGSASAGVGVPLLNVALRSDLQLGKTSLAPLVRVTPTTMSGRVNLAFDPVKIDFAVVLQSRSKVLYRRDLASYSAPSKNVSLLQL